MAKLPERIKIMYIREFEIEHMRDKHPQLLNQIAPDLEQTEDKSGYELPESTISDTRFIALMDAIEDAPGREAK